MLLFPVISLLDARLISLPPANNSTSPLQLQSPSLSHKVTKTSLSPEASVQESQDILFNFNDNMAAPTSPGTYIKNEPEELNFDTSRLTGQSLDMSNSFSAQQFVGLNGDNGNVNPSDIMNGGNFMNNPFASQNMSSSFMMGNSNIADDELLDLGNLDDHHGPNENIFLEKTGFAGQNAHQNHQGGISATGNSGSVHGNQQGRNNAGFSHIHENPPMQGPFVNELGYNQFRNMNLPNQGFSQSLNGGIVGTGVQDMKSRTKISMERQTSNSRSPMTPKTPGMNAFHLHTPDSGSFPPTRPMMGPQIGHRHHKSLSSHWDNTPASGHSWMDSPLPSPQSVTMHPQISEVLTSSSNTSSLQHKLDVGVQAASLPAFQSQEAKRRRRRESHNMVERRRRDNINERIQDLSKLVPQHRLEDEKIRKHIHNNGPLSPGIAATSPSSPQATSLLAGSNGRRMAGNITQGLPPEEKDRQPNKGDILNGAVGWTRDLMWLLYQKLQQENDVIAYLQKIGGELPFEISEEEKRMRTELIDSVENNGPANFQYSRANGSGLHVPKHTDLSGEALPHPISPQSLSPAAHNGGGMAAGMGNNGQPQFWITQAQQGGERHGSFSLKEEDAYNMEI